MAELSLSLYSDYLLRHQIHRLLQPQSVPSISHLLRPDGLFLTVCGLLHHCWATLTPSPKMTRVVEVMVQEVVEEIMEGMVVVVVVVEEVMLYAIQSAEPVASSMGGQARLYTEMLHTRL
ncbi:unnamed protein product [Lota lota]